jgi:L-lysine exporter family protein LysE/ArgO
VPVLTSVIAGFALGLSLIVAIGAQNAFVLRQGLRGQHVLPVVLVCAISDVVLIVAGVAGVGALIERVDGLVDVIRILGAAFLFGYGLLAARRAWRGEGALADDGRGGDGLRVAVATALALTWLNPHVYLDTVLLLGSIAQSKPSPWAFAAGACTASLVWFTALGFGARYLRPLFAKPIAWRILDVAIALIMWTIAASLIAPLLTR